jgi:WD40 repeat protein
MIARFAACLLLLAGATAPAQEKAVRTDLYGDPLPEGAAARLGSMRLRHGSTVYAVAYSPDGKLLASAGDDCLIRVWDPATGKELRRLRGHQNRVSCITFSRDGKLLVTGGDDGTPLVWDVTGTVCPLRERGVKLTDRELAACWEALAGEDPERVWSAVRRLAATPGQAAPSSAGSW